MRKKIVHRTLGWTIWPVALAADCCYLTSDAYNLVGDVLKTLSRSIDRIPPGQA